jgi:hypothetical protein
VIGFSSTFVRLSVARITIRGFLLSSHTHLTFEERAVLGFIYSLITFYIFFFVFFRWSGGWCRMGVAGVGGVGKKANFSELENPPIGKLEFLPTPPTPPLKTYENDWSYVKKSV